MDARQMRTMAVGPNPLEALSPDSPSDSSTAVVTAPVVSTVDELLAVPVVESVDVSVVELFSAVVIFEVFLVATVVILVAKEEREKPLI